ncbi:MAG: 30S ribosomal protein S17 [Candidatus Omnitrophota bacterium]
MDSRGKRKEKIGIVVSDKMDKTITVQVERLTKHAWYNKAQKRYTKYKAHDETRQAHTGDTVRIGETRPLSKTKKWRLLSVVKSTATK